MFSLFIITPVLQSYSGGEALRGKKVKCVEEVSLCELCSVIHPHT